MGSDIGQSRLQVMSAERQVGMQHTRWASVENSEVADERDMQNKSRCPRSDMANKDFW